MFMSSARDDHTIDFGTVTCDIAEHLVYESAENEAADVNKDLLAGPRACG